VWRDKVGVNQNRKGGNYKMKFKCDGCGRETKVGNLAVTLVCQNCGGTDIRFNKSVSAFPVLVGNELGKETIVKKGESFFGRHSQGFVWKIKDRGDLEVDPKENVPSAEDKPKEKTGLVKAIRKLKNPISK